VFTKKYNCHHLVLVESFPTAEAALTREKQLKKWKREWKDKLIATQNPLWNDLAKDWK